MQTIILSNCELWYTRLDPRFPNDYHDKTNPMWEVKARTRSKAQKAEWEAAGLRVRAMIPDNEEPFFQIQICRRKFKADGSERNAPEVVDGNLNPVEPMTIGNKSIANLKVFQYEGPKGKLVSMLNGVQLTTHVVYTPNETASFEKTDTTRITPDEPNESDDTQTELPGWEGDDVPF